MSAHSCQGEAAAEGTEYWSWVWGVGQGSPAWLTWSSVKCLFLTGGRLRGMLLICKVREPRAAFSPRVVSQVVPELE